MRPPEDDWSEPRDVGNGAHDGEDVAVLMGARGAAFMPAALRKMSATAVDLASDLQHTVLEIHERQLLVDELVGDLRSEGVSWASIGWCTGMTAEAARKRWGPPPAAAGGPAPKRRRGRRG